MCTKKVKVYRWAFYHANSLYDTSRRPFSSYFKMRFSTFLANFLIFYQLFPVFSIIFWQFIKFLPILGIICEVFNDFLCIRLRDLLCKKIGCKTAIKSDWLPFLDWKSVNCMPKICKCTHPIVLDAIYCWFAFSSSIQKPYCNCPFCDLEDEGNIHWVKLLLKKMASHDDLTRETSILKEKKTFPQTFSPSSNIFVWPLLLEISTLNSFFNAP